MFWSVLVAASVAVFPNRVAEERLLVFAAASLKDAFTEIASGFQKQTRTRVVLNFGGSQQLAAQINAGAPADVFASAAQSNLDQVSTLKDTREVFARNRLTVVLPSGGHLDSFRGLNQVRRLVLASPKVPAGRYAREAFDRAAKDYGDSWRRTVLSHVVSEEQDVRTVLAKVQLGEADAGIVYVTDARSAGKSVKTVSIPAPFNPPVDYPIAVVASSKSAATARAFVRYVLSQQGRTALSKQGFELPAARGKGG